jgi:hypothetical protein
MVHPTSAVDELDDEHYIELPTTNSFEGTRKGRASSATSRSRNRGDTIESNTSSSDQLPISATPSLPNHPTVNNTVVTFDTRPVRRRGKSTVGATIPNLTRRTTNSRGNQKPHAATKDTCPVLRNLKETVMDMVFSSAPEKIYNLMFTSGFMREFWITQQKLQGTLLKSDRDWGLGMERVTY